MDAAAALLDPPVPSLLAGLLLGRELEVEVDRVLPADGLRRLRAHLDEQWDVRRRRSDLARLAATPHVVVAVSPVTLLLVRDVLAALRRTGSDGAPCAGTVDVRHGRVGLDPAATALTVRLAPAAAADVLADFCAGSGARTGHVRVGDAVRRLGDPVPAWLRLAAAELSRSRAGGDGHATAG